MGIWLHKDWVEHKLSIQRTDGHGPPAILDMLISESESSVLVRLLEQKDVSCKCPTTAKQWPREMAAALYPQSPSETLNRVLSDKQRSLETWKEGLGEPYTGILGATQTP